MNAGAPTILLDRFRELWVHTGTACNLSCPFCHEGSKPGDTRLEGLSPEEIAPLLEEAAARGVERFAFTGGEPLILKGIVPILLHALALRPALVLTNGTAPLIRRSHQLAGLRAAAHPLSFRVSIDYPDEARHDAGRGLRNFRKALEGLRLLHEAGFAVGITRQITPGEDAAAIGQAFRALLRRQRLPQDLPVVALPGLGALDEPPPAAVPVPTAPVAAPACSRGRMLLKRAGALALAPCPLVDDDPSFDAPPRLEAALARPTSALHGRCALCLNAGVNYAGADLPPSV